MSKSLSELAEEYRVEAERLKAKIDELKAQGNMLPTAEYHTLNVYTDMYYDVLYAYGRLEEYLK